MHLTNFEPREGKILAISTTPNGCPAMRFLVHFCPHKPYPYPNFQNRIYACVIPFNQEVKNRVKSFSNEDITFEGDFDLPEGSVILYKSQATIHPQLRSRFECYPVTNVEISTKNILPVLPNSPQPFSIASNLFCPYKRPPDINPQCGLGAAIISNLKEALFYLSNGFLLSSYTPDYMTRFLHSLLRNHILPHNNASNQLRENILFKMREELSPQELIELRSAPSNTTFFKMIERLDLGIYHDKDFKRMVNENDLIFKNFIIFLLHFLNLSFEEFDTFMANLEISDHLKNTLKIGNIRINAFRIVARLLLRDKHQLPNDISDQLIADHLAGTKPWTAMTKPILYEELNKCHELLDYYLKKPTIRDLNFVITGIVLKSEIKRFMLNLQAEINIDPSEAFLNLIESKNFFRPQPTYRQPLALQ